MWLSSTLIHRHMSATDRVSHVSLFQRVYGLRKAAAARLGEPLVMPWVVVRTSTQADSSSSTRPGLSFSGLSTANFTNSDHAQHSPLGRLTKKPQNAALSLVTVACPELRSGALPLQASLASPDAPKTRAATSSVCHGGARGMIRSGSHAHDAKVQRYNGAQRANYVVERAHHPTAPWPGPWLRLPVLDRPTHGAPLLR